MSPALSLLLVISGIKSPLLRFYRTKGEYLDGYRLRRELRECEIGQIDLHSILRVSPAWSDSTHMRLHFTVNYQVLFIRRSWCEKTL